MFSLGRKKTTSTTFKTTTIAENNRVYGEAKIEFRRGKFSLNTTRVLLNTIKTDCLDELFLQSLYLIPTSELLEDYGPLVITGYYTGGRASALYLGSSDYTYDMESTEKDMESNISASIKLDSISGNGSLTLKNNKGNTEIATTKITNLSCYFHTKGGINGYDGDVKKIEDLNVNLTSWLNSLTDTNTHVMIDFLEDGKSLFGLSEFILEENFSLRIQDTHLGFVSSTEFTEPFIEIAKVYVRTSSSGEKLYEIAPILNTRQGDQIILNDGKASQASDAELRANNHYDTFMERSRAIAEEKRKYYQCDITANPNKTIDPRVRIPFNLSYPGFKEAGMYKFKNEDTNIWYIYNPETKYAFSFYDLDNYIPEIYGINDWTDTIPEKKISMLSLSMFYKVIGL